MTLAVDSAPSADSRILTHILSARRAWLSMDRNPQALAFAQTSAGVALVHLAFLALLGLSNQFSLASLTLIGATLGLVALYPSRRWAILGVAGAVFFVLRPFRTGEKIGFVYEKAFSAELLANLEPLFVQAGFAALFLGLVLCALKLQKRWSKSLASRRPLLAMLTVLGGLLVVGLQLEPGGHAFAIAWTFTLLLSSSFFFLAYLFADQRVGAATPDGARLGFVRPFWGGPGVPFKGPAFLAKFEAKTPEALAATRLRALKLMAWAVILALLAQALHALFYGLAGLPTLPEVIVAHATGTNSGRANAVAVLAKNFLMTLIWAGAFSHGLVAVVRMVGFGIPRDMTRPLSARTIAEFWNRYVFYFKEILVDFFFYPAFARFFKGRPKLRVAFATFCAAFVGNVLYSLIAQANLFAEIGPLGVLRHFESYSFYALLLTIALVVSQLRKKRPRPEDGWLRYEFLPRASVISLFAFLLIFADESGSVRLVDRLDFAFWLFFL